MPRLRPRPTQQEEEPLPIITAPEPPVGDIEIELPEDIVGDSEVVLAPPEPERRPEPERPSDDDAVVRAAEATRRADDLQRQLTDANRREQDRSRELERERGDRETAEYNSVLTAIAAEQSAIDKAEADYAAAASVGDWSAASKAQRVMATASARLTSLEAGKDTFEARRDTTRETPQQRREESRSTPAELSVDQQIDAIQVPDNAKAWLRKHPEFVIDKAKLDRLGAAHNYLEKVENVTPFSQAYFDALDTRFGFKEPERAPPAPQTQRRSMPVSAPVSRDVPTTSGQRQSSSKITLSEEQRRIARNSFTAPDMTDAQKELLYAKNLRKLQDMKANGSYSERRE